MCCAPRSVPLLCKTREHHKEEKEARKLADEEEAKDQAADDAEAGHAGSADSTPAAVSESGEAAAHASAY